MQGKSIDIRNEQDISAVRNFGRKAAKETGFGPVDQSRIITVVSELARNIYKYAGQGSITLLPLIDGAKKGLSIIAKDNGQGIEDIDNAMEQGFSTSGSLGAGLPAVKRMVDEFQIQSEKGQGTCIKATKWIR
ncbi:anti-sigma regulatory factor [Mesobacillus foraminis]|uniref:anti-sigma regulatory factor n=1 Tax=Mesobacillus foraminis TaxID=279826 RepID=UPI000EF4B34A|nr:anti-sigma regulatory factor [Mesobacillus foraminis]